MALNASGPISLGGSTVGQSIAVELGQSSTGQISLGDSAVRTLAGVSSGAIAMPADFWGKSNAPTVIGQAFGGGYYGGKVVDGNVTYYLIVAPSSSGQSYLKWKTSDTSTAGTSSLVDGPTNSANMNNASHPAAQFCKGLSIGGYTDWYLPAKNELEVLYYFLKPTTQTNNGSNGWGSNANAITPEPVSTPYTNSAPPQTSAAAFQSGGSQQFNDDLYWSSSEQSATAAWRQFFFDGRQNYFGDAKTSNSYVRAVRRVPALTVGQAFGGGYFAGYVSYPGTGQQTYALVVAPKSSGQAARAWASVNGSTGATSVVDGVANTNALNSASYPAAQFCKGLSIGGYTDWYMPSLNELEILYYFLKPTTDSNYTSSGSNANAAYPEPRNTNYTSGSPAQTNVSAFQSGNSEAFSSFLWASTDYNSNTLAWNQNFSGGYSGWQTSESKDIANYVRAIRRVAL